MISAFERMTQSVLTVLGEDALFNGVMRCRINIEYDVQFAGIEGEQAQYRGDISLPRDVATVPASVTPTVGKTFRFVDTDGTPTGPTYRLDKLVDANGYTKRFIVLKSA